MVLITLFNKLKWWQGLSLGILHPYQVGRPLERNINEMNLSAMRMVCVGSLLKTAGVRK